MSTCQYKTVTLKPGEIFTLPAGATLIAATDESAISSTCDIPTLEPLECYTCVVGLGENSGTTSQLWEVQSGSGGDVRIKGILQNDQLQVLTKSYTFDSLRGISVDGLTGTPALNIFKQDLKDNVAELFQIHSITQYWSGGRWYQLFITVKSTTSIIKRLAVQMRTSAPGGSGSGEILADFSFYPTSSSYIQGLPNKPTCS
jgi:hypothetical protein